MSDKSIEENLVNLRIKMIEAEALGGSDIIFTRARIEADVNHVLRSSWQQLADMTRAQQEIIDLKKTKDV